MRYGFEVVRTSPFLPSTHFFVCANRREGSPLGPGCGDSGERVFSALKRRVAAEGRVTSIWVTRTHCLGVCPSHGGAVALVRANMPYAIHTEVDESDVAALFAEWVTP